MKRKFKRVHELNLGWFTKEFSKKIKLLKRKPLKPVILTAAGPSRVGKTTALKFIQKKLPYFARIAHDEMRLFLRRLGYKEKKVEGFIREARPSFALAEKFLGAGYSVILDDNFATEAAKEKLVKNLAGKLKTKFFVIKAWGPPAKIKKRLRGVKTKLFPDWRAGIEHFERSRKQFDYGKFNKIHLAKVNTAKPLRPQLEAAIEKLGEAMSGNL